MKSDATNLILLDDRATASINGFLLQQIDFNFHPGYVPNRPFSVLVLELAAFKHNDLNSIRIDRSNLSVLSSVSVTTLCRLKNENSVVSNSRQSFL